MVRRSREEGSCQLVNKVMLRVHATSSLDEIKAVKTVEEEEKL